MSEKNQGVQPGAQGLESFGPGKLAGGGYEGQPSLARVLRGVAEIAPGRFRGRAHGVQQRGRNIRPLAPFLPGAGFALSQGLPGRLVSGGQGVGFAPRHKHDIAGRGRRRSVHQTAVHQQVHIGGRPHEQ